MTSSLPSRQGSFTSPPPSASPRRPSGLGGGQSAEQRRARREQFRSFYGLKGGPGVVEGQEKEGEGSKTGDPLEINSPNFNAPAYYEDLIKKSSLTELMQAASSLSADVNNLQSSRHFLVYNHHHQLFAAGDTISHLNSRTPQLISIMTSLQDSFSSISQLADSVALPEKGNPDTEQDKEAALRLDLQRIRLMVLAGNDGEEIREVWSGLDKGVVADAELSREIREAQELVNGLPPSITITTDT